MRLEWFALVVCVKQLTLGLLLYDSDSQKPKEPKGYIYGPNVGPPARTKAAIKVLAFGDSWVEFGPSYKMLIDLFRKKNIPANVQAVARSGTRACQWAANPNNLKVAVEQNFGKDGADYIWYSLGGNDLMDPHYTICAGYATSSDAAKKCLKYSTSIINACTNVLLDSMWAIWPRTEVLQSGYEMECQSNTCFPLINVPYCGQDVGCRHSFVLEWQSMLLEPRMGKRYTGLNILGTLQKMNGDIRAAPGRPRLDVGSPCYLMQSCVHPQHGPASDAIGQVFWDLYFRSRLNVHDVRGNPADSLGGNQPRMPVDLPAVGPSTNFENYEDNLTMCMWEWKPSLDSPIGLPTECKRDWEALTGLGDEQWFNFMA